MEKIKKIYIKFGIAVTFMLAPFLTFAQGGGRDSGRASGRYFGEVDTFFTRIGGFINDILIPLLFTVALLFFVYGMFRYFVLGGASDENRATGRKIIWWSIIGFVLAVSIWGIVNAIAGGLFGGTSAPPELPGIPTL